MGSLEDVWSGGGGQSERAAWRRVGVSQTGQMWYPREAKHLVTVGAKDVH